MKNKIQVIQKWVAPLTNVKPFKNGAVELVKEKSKKGYLHGGSYGVEFTEIKSNYEENILMIDSEAWMSDGPHNFLTIQNDVDFMRSGTVCLGGLGLGLHLICLQKRPDITEIVVIENRYDVIASIAPIIPTDDRIKIIHEDFYDYCDRYCMRFDNYHWDCFKGGSDYVNTVFPAVGTLTWLKEKYKSDCNLIFHGAPSMNVLQEVAESIKLKIKNETL